MIGFVVSSTIEFRFTVFVLPLKSVEMISNVFRFSLSVASTTKE